MYYAEVIPGLVCVLCFVDIKSDDYFSPCTHLSGAIPVNSESGCWCIEPGCEAEPTDLSSPIILWFLLRDEFNTHAVEPALFPVACCMLLPCCGLPVSVVCQMKREQDLPLCGLAVELVGGQGGGCVHSVILCCCNSWCRILLWEITQASVGVQPCWPSYSVLS